MSGIPFLDELPTGWELQPAVALAETLTSTVDKKEHEGEQRVRLCNYTDVYYGDRIVDPSNFMVATASAAQISAFSVRAGDVPFTKDSETSDDIGIPAYIPNDLPGVVYGYHLSIYRPRDRRYGRFMRYLLESSYAKATFRTKTPGVTRVGLSRNTVNYFRVPTPPAEDAVHIADFLDRETAQIDEFVAENEQLIALLAERRAAVIAQAVTNGLDPKVPMQDSGVEWLGEVPANWDVVRLKFACVALPGFAFASDEFNTDERGTKLLRGANVGVGAVKWEDVVYVENAEGVAEYELNEGDIVVGMDRPVIGGGLRVASIRSADLPSYLVQRVLRLRGTRGDNEFIRHSLAWGGFAAYIEPDFTGISVPHMSETQMGNFTMAFPALAEQRRIVAYLDEQTASIDKAIATAREAIALAKERRAALISAAVTGKIQVEAGAS